MLGGLWDCDATLRKKKKEKKWKQHRTCFLSCGVSPVASRHKGDLEIPGSSLGDLVLVRCWLCCPRWRPPRASTRSERPWSRAPGRPQSSRVRGHAPFVFLAMRKLVVTKAFDRTAFIAPSRCTCCPSESLPAVRAYTQPNWTVAIYLPYGNCTNLKKKMKGNEFTDDRNS